MSKRITVEELAANLEEHLAEIEAGGSLMITKEGRTIARIAPAVQVQQRGTPWPFRNLNLSPRPKKLDIDPAQLIIEEREYERSGKKHGF